MKRLLLAALLCLLALPAGAQVKPATLVPASTVNLSITTGGVWQQIFPQNFNRYVLFVENYCSATTQNIAGAESLFIYFQQGTTVPTGNPWTIGAVELTNCGSMTFNNTATTTQAVYMWAATSAHGFSAWQNQ